MKCTNLRDDLELLHLKEMEELKQALLAHGGEYVFATGADEDYPEVTAEYYYEWVKFKVVKALIGNNGELCIDGKACTESGACFVDQEICNMPARDVKVGDMVYIISHMDEPKQKNYPALSNLCMQVNDQAKDVICDRMKELNRIKFNTVRNFPFCDMNGDYYSVEVSELKYDAENGDVIACDTNGEEWSVQEDGTVDGCMELLFYIEEEAYKVIED